MEDDIILNKIAIVVRCMKRVNEEYQNATPNFLSDYSNQDAAILNLQRAIQAVSDIAAHVIRHKSLALPKDTKDLFITLGENKIISEHVRSRMIKMVGFRNILVHEYQKLDMNIVVSVIEKQLSDFEQFIQEILKAN